MSKITQVFEDLASGRPIKKPVKSNLLKARKDANEKDLKSGFMKMPDYARKKFDEEKEEEYKPHYMYKGDKKVYAKKKEDHDKLNKQGYDHDDPKTKKIEEGKKKGLWDNIHARRKKGLPPKKPGQEGYPKTLNIEEKKPKNCGCGQDPCITYGKGGKMEKEQVNEISDEMKMRYISKANKQISSAEKERLAGKGHAVKTDKDYDRLVSKPLKRRKGVVQAKSKLGENYEKGRGPTGIAFAIQKGHPDAENPKTRKKYPERQPPEYKANWKKQQKASMTNPPIREEKKKGLDGK